MPLPGAAWILACGDICLVRQAGIDSWRVLKKLYDEYQTDSFPFKGVGMGMGLLRPIRTHPHPSPPLEGEGTTALVPHRLAIFAMVRTGNVKPVLLLVN